MIQKRTVVDLRQVSENGIIMIRFRKELVENGNVLSFGYHRTALEPGGDLDKQMAVVNAHLVAMECKPVADYASVRRIVQAEHTPGVIAAWKAEQEKAK